MNEKQSPQSLVVDDSKRRTLKSVTGLAAGSALLAMPALASAAQLLDNQINGLSAEPVQHSDQPPADLGAILVSIPGREGESLILQNLTDKDINIERFHANKIVFDGETVDCNDACALSTISVPAKDKVLVRFKPQANNNLSSPVGEYLDVQSQIQRLPEGTRYVRLAVHMTGNSAVLSSTDISAVAA